MSTRQPWHSNQKQRPRTDIPQATRRRIMTRDRRTCQLALPGCQIRATQIDHIKPWSQGGTTEPSNLQAVCDKCHSQKTQREAQAAKQTHARKRPPTTKTHPFWQWAQPTQQQP